MSFLTTHPEALAAAAGELQTIGSALTAQNTAAAGPITGLAPAAADEISMLQATQFSAYGTLYEQISAQAAAMQEMFVHTLRASAESYGSTETANSAAAGLGAATGTAGAGTAGAAPIAAAADPTFGLGGIASNASILAAMQGGTIGSAASEFTGMGKGYITSPSGVVHHVDEAFAAGLASQVAPAGSTAATPAPVAMGQTPPALGTSAPPSWAGEAAPAGTARPPLPGAAASAAAAPHASTTAIPAGIPGAASDRGTGGRMRYGIKPKIIPRPSVG